MSTSRFLVFSLLASTPLLFASCSTEEPADDGDSGTGNAIAGSNAGTSGSAGSISAGGAGTGGGGSGGAPTAGRGGGSGTAGSSAGLGGSAGASSGGGGSGGASSGTAGSTAGSTAGGGSGGVSAGSGGQAGSALGGAGSGGAGGSGGSGGGGDFVLTSSKIESEAIMSNDFTCQGDAHSPPLAWSGAPAGTMSFAMVFLDTTILEGNPTSAMGHHSAIWDIPATTTALPEDLPTGASITTPVTAKQFSPVCAGYLGPCPNTTPEHSYEFRLYALSVATLTLPGGQMSVLNIKNAIEDSEPLDQTSLVAKSAAMGGISCAK